MQKHGILLDGLNGEETICPGDYIVTDRKGNRYRLPAGEFEALYEPTHRLTRSQSEVTQAAIDPKRERS